MGICNSYQKKATPAQLAYMVKRMRMRYEIQKDRIKQEGSQYQKQLLRQINKPLHSRNKTVQDLLIEQVTNSCNRFVICTTLISQCQKIQKQKDGFQNEHFYKIQKSVRMLIYCRKIIHIPQIQDFEQMLNSKYPNLPSLNPDEVQNQLINQQKFYSRPRRTSLNSYVMNLCRQQQINLDKFNQVGHQYNNGF